MSLYKIQLFVNDKKYKRKLYETEATYNRWWEERKKDVARYNSYRDCTSGMVGYIDGVVDRTYGTVPEPKEVTK